MSYTFFPFYLLHNDYYEPHVLISRSVDQEHNLYLMLSLFFLMMSDMGTLFFLVSDEEDADKS